MRKWFLMSMITVTFLIGCQSSPRYAKDILQLENFKFGLNIDSFFEDESYFRIANDNYKIRSEEETLEDTTFTYFRYETVNFDSKNPLAEYKDVKFDELNLLTDSTDQHVLLINGVSRGTTSQDVKKIIDDLSKIDPNPQVVYTSMSGIGIAFRGSDRIVSVYLDTYFEPINIQTPSNYDYYKEYTEEELEELKKIYLTKDIYQQIFQQLKDKEELDFYLFIIDPSFDKIYNSKSRSSSGFMTKYKTKNY